jgi:kynurenine formamidase
VGHDGQVPPLPVATRSPLDVSPAFPAAAGAVQVVLLRPFKKYDVSTALERRRPIGLEHLKAAEARGGFRLEDGDVAVLQTDGGGHAPPAELSSQACEYLTHKGVAAVGWDAPALTHDIHEATMTIAGLRNLADAPPTGIALALSVVRPGAAGPGLRVLLMEG